MSTTTSTTATSTTDAKTVITETTTSKATAAASTTTAATTSSEVDTKFLVYTTRVKALNGTDVFGRLTFFGTPKGVLGTGKIFNLEPGLSMERLIGVPDCALENGCTIQVHSGTCENIGAPFHSGEMNPWQWSRYHSTNAQGTANIQFSVSTAKNDIDKKLAVVYSNDGFPAACGKIFPVLTDLEYTTLNPVRNSGAAGVMTVWMTTTYLWGAGSVSGLEPYLLAERIGGHDCKDDDACSVAVRSGDSCGLQHEGAKFFGDEKVDPWTGVGFTSTDENGYAEFVFNVKFRDSLQIRGKPFTVHNSTGSEVACGLVP
eukprot:CAMPEP_0170623522 /NCGR_PEP_ID=MMETSP0224-20130122/29745_1 /TAXON_ID=285029 /ORGANISM="Togula jolla, Strain CCCM 725" /LENGTH=315 /DNA_ID=CAMNT_0010949985 /DNA_START=334 /DNA_END=1281 /DNA_ORIENTATION=-